MEKQTVGYYLNQLPEEYRKKAINNTNKNQLDKQAHSISQALSIAFIWKESQEKHEYWNNVYNSLPLK